MKTRILCLILSFFFFKLFSIQVGGHIIEDTTWNPVNNPYEVMEILYVDSDVTLTILPGTEIRVSGASCTSWQEFDQNFWLYSGESVAKFIQVDGRIIAEGTEQDSIIFTRLQDDPNYNWGTINITENAEHCIFKYCKIEHISAIGLALSNISKGLSFYNGKGSIRNCTFLNHAVGISSNSSTEYMEIIDNSFIINSNINPFLLITWTDHIVTYRDESIYSPALLICHNVFDGYDETYWVAISRKTSFAFNIISDCYRTSARSHYYKNTFINCEYGIRTGYVGDSLYIKQNNFIGGYNGVDIDDAYVEISDNYFEGCNLDSGLDSSGEVYNNIIYYGSLYSTSYLIVCNNVTYNGTTGIIVTYRNEINSNNISINNQYAFGGYFNGYYNNCIILANEELTQYGVSSNPIFRNCIIDFELEYPLIDGGGNIIVDSLQTQSIFEDIQNGDFHLTPGSIAIDAGFDTLGYYYPFDLDYNHRVWDGDGNGTAIIDIGPYEYGAPAFGGIEGITFDPITGDFVDYVLIKINNEPGEFTFSDSIGYYQYKLPVGVYDIYAERVFYDDTVEYQIEVVDGQFTQLDIPMCETVNVQNYEIIPIANDFNLSNYPNPFNPTTTISFSIRNDIKTELSIFNIKGQKIKTLIYDQLSKGKHSIVWLGCDQNGHKVSSGIYFYKLKVGNQESVKRMLLLK
ncbi:MAG TPA: T9SS type A sorting domain-containing protein [Candidatus Cloacimonadota bacterium]|nr:T9SS type A sorting domain-containing protein [Candidatus Cloacimonadota bacterium]